MNNSIILNNIESIDSSSHSTGSLDAPQNFVTLRSQQNDEISNDSFVNRNDSKLDDYLNESPFSYQEFSKTNLEDDELKSSKIFNSICL